jgi:fimbrial isopeptide formation D2 family protein/LPXTG-motif cell wall-anchored protein
MSALAAPADVTLKVTDAVDGHDYVYYQLLVGDLSGDKTKLSNVVWGADVAASITYGEKTIAPVADEEVPEDFLTYLSGLTGDDEAIANTVSAMVTGDGHAISANGVTVKTGYYVVKDAYTDPAAEQTTTLSTNVVRIVESTAITPKAGTTEHKKEVADINDSTEVAFDLNNLKGIDSSKWDDSADYDFGDKVPFKLTTKIGSDFAKYDNYYLAVNDTLKDGLKLDQDSIKVYVDGELATEGTEAGQYSLTKADKSFKVEFTKLNGNAKAAAGKEVVVYYTATLDAATAVIGETGNWNESFAEFSNNPNGNQEGKGHTPKDTAVVFTYKTDVDKVNKDKQPLVGAEFTLTKKLKNGTTVDIAVVKFTKDGVETTKVADGTSTSQGDATKFSFKGLDDGIYTLTETVTPDGYNTIDPVTFQIVATHNGEGHITDLDVQNEDGTAFTGNLEFTKSAPTGTLATSVVNNSGATLPSTGGIGTTIFYIAGGILVLAAVILLVTKRRMSSND